MSDEPEPTAPSSRDGRRRRNSGRGSEGGSRWSHPVEDLSDEWDLKTCAPIEFEGRMRPSLGRVAVLARLGRGGMGVVYYGVNPRLDSEVAIKILPRSIQARQPDMAERFLREARLAARLRSEHLVSVLDVDEDAKAGCHFLVMEYVRGITARAWAKEHVQSGDAGIPELHALEVAIAATKGLQAAHVEGIVHRDVKPDNILIPCDADGRPYPRRSKLADMGLARAELSEEGLTGTNVAMGTPGYMAPEQATDAKTAGKPADVFGMGATLYGMLIGHAPFRGSSPSDALLKTVKGEYPPLRIVRPGISAPTLAVVETCLRQEPSQRFPDASALLEALRVAREALQLPQAKAAETTSAIQEFVRREEKGKKVGEGEAARVIPQDAASSSEVPVVREPRVAASDDDVFSSTRIEKPDLPIKASIPWVLLLLAVAAAALWFVLRGGDEGGGGGKTPPVVVPRDPDPAPDPGPDPPPPEPRPDPAPGPGPTPPPVTPDGGTSPGPVDPPPRPARLEVHGTPVGAQVRLTGIDDPAIVNSGTLAADGAWLLPEVPAGRYRLEVAADGYLPHTATLDLDWGDEFRRDVALTALPATVDLSGIADGVTVTLDGNPVSGRIQVPAGDHVLRLSRAGHLAQDRVISPARGETLVVNAAQWQPSASGWLFVFDDSAGQDAAARAVDDLAADLPEGAWSKRSKRSLGLSGDLRKGLVEAGLSEGRAVVVYVAVDARVTGRTKAHGADLSNAAADSFVMVVESLTGGVRLDESPPAATGDSVDDASALRKASTRAREAVVAAVRPVLSQDR